MATKQDVDWQSTRSLQECNRYMLENAVASDVQFQTRTDDSLTTVHHAHKYVLASRSSVFFAMLYGPMAETTDLITIPDIPTDAFKLFLQYLYTDGVSLTGENVCAILYTATKYCVSTLASKCESFLKTNMTVDNVCNILITANTLGQKELVESSLNFILKKKEVFNHRQMNQLNKDCFRLVIASDNLAFAETDILKVVLGWAENQCRKENQALTASNKRNILGDILFLVRFPLVDTKVFVDTADSGLLTQEEQLEVFKSVARGKSAIGGKFSTKPRVPHYHLCMASEALHLEDHQTVLLFQCSKRTNIMGILCRFGDVKQSYNFDSTLIIYPSFEMFNQYLDPNEIYGEEVRKHQKLSVSAETTEYEVMFPSAICLEPNEYHLLYFTIKQVQRSSEDSDIMSCHQRSSYKAHRISRRQDAMSQPFYVSYPEGYAGTVNSCNSIDFTFHLHCDELPCPVRKGREPLVGAIHLIMI